jgi:hypothetical protein
MFIDLGDSEIKTIVQGQDIEILEIIIEGYQIEGRHFKASTQFFTYFCDQLIKFYPDKSEREPAIIKFRHIFENLLNSITAKTRMTKDQFLDFNHKFEAHPDFNDFLKMRDDLGVLLKKIGQ